MLVLFLRLMWLGLSRPHRSPASPSQDLAVLRADYERKLLRQGYYFERKKAFLGHMLRQASWHKMLELCLAIEVPPPPPSSNTHPHTDTHTSRQCPISVVRHRHLVTVFSPWQLPRGEASRATRLYGSLPASLAISSYDTTRMIQKHWHVTAGFAATDLSLV